MYRPDGPTWFWWCMSWLPCAVAEGQRARPREILPSDLCDLGGLAVQVEGIAPPDAVAARAPAGRGGGKGSSVRREYQRRVPIGQGGEGDGPHAVREGVAGRAGVEDDEGVQAQVVEGDAHGGGEQRRVHAFCLDAEATAALEHRRSSSRNVWMNSFRQLRLSASERARKARGNPPRSQCRACAVTSTMKIENRLFDFHGTSTGASKPRIGEVMAGSRCKGGFSGCGVGGASG